MDARNAVVAEASVDENGVGCGYVLRLEKAEGRQSLELSQFSGCLVGPSRLFKCELIAELSWYTGSHVVQGSWCSSTQVNFVQDQDCCQWLATYKQGTR